MPRYVTTIGGRPAIVQTDLSSSSDVYVLCRLDSGEDVHVPLSAIFQLFAKEMGQAAKAKASSEITETGSD